MGTFLQGLFLLIIANTGLPPVSAQTPRCAVKHQPFVQGGVAHGEMRITNTAEGCNFVFKFGGKFEPSTWKVEQAPKHGHLDAAGSTVTYLPENGYTGPDEFTVAVFGVNPMYPRHEARDGRFHFNVSVNPTR